MHPSLEDTITAVATPNGVGAISIIRLSGNKAIEAANVVFRGKKVVSEMNTHTVHYGKIVDQKGEFVDDVVLSLFKSPHSYTGEDVIELSTHGNPLISQKIIEIFINQGVRIAEPGEFTKRAFLNNRIDLAQAEAVIDIINSRSDASLKGSRNQLDGLLSQNVAVLRQSLLDTLSFLELELDFAEEDIKFVANEELFEKINLIIEKIDALLASYKFGKVVRDGVNVAIVGKPNVGKSSLLNYLLKESRAIVSHIPGTTRDIIKEEISIDGILFKLHDTAGIRTSDDTIEIEGVRRSNEAVKNSDMVLFVSDVEQGFSKELYDELLQLTNKERIIHVTNKIDLVKGGNWNGIGVSAVTGQGMNELTVEIKKHAFGDNSYSEKSAVVSNIRHYNCLSMAKESLVSAINAINHNLSGEFIAIDIRKSLDSLGEIIGEVTSDDVLNNIFSKFCIGK